MDAENGEPLVTPNSDVQHGVNPPCMSCDAVMNPRLLDIDPLPVYMNSENRVSKRRREDEVQGKDMIRQSSDVASNDEEDIIEIKMMLEGTYFGGYIDSENGRIDVATVEQGSERPAGWFPNKRQRLYSPIPGLRPLPHKSLTTPRRAAPSPLHGVATASGLPAGEDLSNRALGNVQGPC